MAKKDTINALMKRDVSEEVAKECLRLAATKIGIHTKFITRAGVKI